ncbi:MAG: alpha/beta hydrolase-fold protein [Clostridiales bacterium]|nr:alpha/beta hydrolase-fold protein [Clostridiales bacterium]
MNIEYCREYSRALNRDMEYKIYGHAGKPVMFIPCQDGRFFDFENFHMVDVWAQRIERGEVQVFSVDTIDKETWSDKGGDCRYRLELHERWFSYLTEELVPRIHARSNRNGFWNAGPGIMTFGCSMGAMHAANLYYRRPDLFDRNLSLSGIYDTEDSFGGYHDDLTYQNSPIQFLAHMPANHPWMDRYRNNKAVICVGQGAWEDLMQDSTRKLEGVLRMKNIPTWVDFWGHDVNHDWPWWYKQVEYFLPYLLDERE